jgi:hypothetical protein
MAWPLQHHLAPMTECSHLRWQIGPSHGTQLLTWLHKLHIKYPQHILMEDSKSMDPITPTISRLRQLLIPATHPQLRHFLHYPNHSPIIHSSLFNLRTTLVIQTVSMSPIKLIPLTSLRKRASRRVRIASQPLITWTHQCTRTLTGKISQLMGLTT